jgi:hypothetical protein
LSIRAVLVDDNSDDLRYAERLTRDGIDCDKLPPPSTSEELRRQIAARRARNECDIVLLDYRLDAEGTATESRRDYRGGTVAAELREHLPDLPIVLVSTEEKLRKGLAGKSDVRGLFDHKVLKQRIASRSERKAVVVELLDLAEGFRKVASEKTDGWDRILRALSRESLLTTLSRLEMTAPPVGTAEICGWILDDLLAYPSLLLDEHDASATLGIAVATFRRNEVQTAVDDYRYKGVFANMYRRWWMADLTAWLTSLAGGEPGVAGENRSRLIAKALDLSPQAARAASCVWCGSKDVVRACSICREHIDPLHGLHATIDDRPRWASQAVACFKCIEAGRADHAHFQPGTESIVRGIKTGRVLRGS